jgi:hypothetical protein
MKSIPIVSLVFIIAGTASQILKLFGEDEIAASIDAFFGGLAPVFTGVGSAGLFVSKSPIQDKK